MMDLNRNNYELYVIDYIEGNLSSDMEQQMRTFLSENPDISAEIDGVGEFALDSEPINSVDWSHLKKTDLDDEAIFEDVCIASVEKENSPEIDKQLEDYLEMHPEKSHDYYLYQSTILKPETSIQFFGKEGLKKKSFKISPLVYIAASIISVAIILFVSGNRTKVPTSLLASVEPIQVELEVPALKIEKNEFKTILPVQQFDEKLYIEENIAQLEARNEIYLRPMVSKQVAVEFVEYQPLFALAEMPIENTLIEIESAKEELFAANENQNSSGNLKTVLAEKGLSFLKQLSNDRLDYTSGTNGKIKRVEYTSRLMAVSIPLKSN